MHLHNVALNIPENVQIPMKRRAGLWNGYVISSSHLRPKTLLYKTKTKKDRNNEYLQKNN